MGTLLAEQNIRGIALCKMDIEGGEKRVFEKGLEWLKKIKMLILETHDGVNVDSIITNVKNMNNYLHLERRNKSTILFHDDKASFKKEISS